jgi:hypothetical protein
MFIPSGAPQLPRRASISRSRRCETNTGLGSLVPSRSITCLTTVAASFPPRLPPPSLELGLRARRNPLSVPP